MKDTTQRVSRKGLLEQGGLVALTTALLGANPSPQATLVQCCGPIDLTFSKTGAGKGNKKKSGPRPVACPTPTTVSTIWVMAPTSGTPTAPANCTYAFRVHLPSVAGQDGLSSTNPGTLNETLSNDLWVFIQT